MSFPYQPTGYRVCIRQEKIEKKTDGGIILLDQDGRKQGGQTFGYIESMGDLAFVGKDFAPEDRSRYEWAMKNNIKVLYRKYAGETFKEDHNNPDSNVYHFCADLDILAIHRGEQ